jgi:hypothetical protein
MEKRSFSSRLFFIGQISFVIGDFPQIIQQKGLWQQGVLASRFTENV